MAREPADNDRGFRYPLGDLPRYGGRSHSVPALPVL